MDIDTLHVTSTFSAHHGGYEMGGYQFKNDPWNYFVFGMGIVIMAVTVWNMF